MFNLHKKTRFIVLLTGGLIAGLWLYSVNRPIEPQASVELSPREEAARRLKLLNETADALAIDGITLPPGDPVGTVTEQFDEALIEFNQQFEAAPRIETQIAPPIDDDAHP